MALCSASTGSGNVRPKMSFVSLELKPRFSHAACSRSISSWADLSSPFSTSVESDMAVSVMCRRETGAWRPIQVDEGSWGRGQNLRWSQPDPMPNPRT